jgi:hypothetical protein
MRIVIAIAAILFTTHAHAQSCTDIANQCLGIALQQGLSRAEWQAKCFDKERMAVCKKTLQYNAPSGRTWKATKP